MEYMIRSLSDKCKLTPDIKRSINNSKSLSGQGCLFIGKSNESKNIRMLVGAHFSSKSFNIFSSNKLNIGVFGGSNELNELVIETVIRETIEEIFNFKPTPEMVMRIRDFLNENTDLYFIYLFKESFKGYKSYSYIFDVNILGNFIIIINQINKYQMIPIKSGMINISMYLDNHNFNLNRFMIERDIEQIKAATGLYEIKYLSFPSLYKLVKNNKYELYNFNTNKRELLEYQPILIKLLQTNIIKDILTIGNIK